MKRVVINFLDEVKSKLGGYTGLLSYQLSCFCTEAEAVALLALEVETEEDNFNIEDVADVANPQKDQFAILPKDDSYLYPISKAISKTYPEFEVEIKEKDDKRYLICTVPEVNDDRKKAGMDYVDAAYKFNTGKMEASLSAYTAKSAVDFKDLSDEEKNELADNIKEINDFYKKQCDKAKEDKEKKIEEAYQRYLTKQAEKASEEQEKKDSAGIDAGKKLNLS